MGSRVGGCSFISNFCTNSINTPYRPILMIAFSSITSLDNLRSLNEKGSKTIFIKGYPTIANIMRFVLGY